MDVRKVFEKTVQKFPQKPAVIFGDKSVSFKALEEEVCKLAGALKASGVRKGDKVAIYLPNCLEFIYGYLASFYLGAVVVPLDFLLKTDELISCLSHCEPKVLLMRAKPDVNLSDVRRAAPSIKTVISCTNHSSETTHYSDFIKKGQSFSGTVPFPQVDIKDSEPALIMYTSGTTGKPKGILLNYKHLEGSPKAMEHFVDLSDKDIKLAAIPLSHIGGFIYLQNCIHFGITIILMDRFSPFEFLQNIVQYKVTCFHIVPPMYTAMLSVKELDKYDLSSLRWVVVFGAPSSPETLERFHKYCPNAKLLNGWGMTETSPPNTVTPMTSNNIASIGKPSPHCEIKIFDPEKEGTEQCSVRTGEIGEIVIRGSYIMAGYYKDKEATAEMMRNGWLYTGDLGKFDSEGFLYIVGRKKEMIKVAGQIVYAPEVEIALLRHEAIAEVAVVGAPDKMKGEIVKAFVVLKAKDGASAEDIRSFAREHLARFKVPDSIEFRDQLPKNRVGKIDKALLKQNDAGVTC